MNEVEIKKIDGAIRDSFLYVFEPTLRGQTLYILEKCREAGIKCIFENKSVRIFSARKLDKFRAIIEESYNSYSPPMKLEKTQLYMDGRETVCFANKFEETIYMVNSKIEKVLMNQFMGKLPVTNHYRIFTSLGEMETTLLDECGIII